MFNKYKNRKEIALHCSTTKNIQYKYQFSGRTGENSTLTSSESDVSLHLLSILRFSQEMSKLEQKYPWTTYVLDCFCLTLLCISKYPLELKS